MNKKKINNKEIGLTGPNGLRGQTGPTGPNGLIGPTGPEGSSISPFSIIPSHGTRAINELVHKSNSRN